MRKILKWLGILIGSLLGILVLALGFLFVVGMVRWDQEYENYNVDISALSIPTDEATIDSGQHLVRHHGGL